MSRNLGRTDCAYCHSRVRLLEVPRSIRQKEAKGYHDEYRDLIVANAECPACLAKYLAWVRWSYNTRNARLVDLSFRSSFNDEPGEQDLPVYQVELRAFRVGPYVPCTTHLRLGPVDQILLDAADVEPEDEDPRATH